MNCASSQPCDQAYIRMTDRNYKIGNVDVTLILEAPKVSNFS